MLLIRKAIICHPASKFHGKRLDILIEKGVITQIKRGISNSKARVIEGENLHVSGGWFDFGVQACDPGLEHRDDLDSIAKSAVKGGYTGLAIFPNTNPVLDSKSLINYIFQRSEKLPLDVFPIGAVSQGCDGRDLTEIYDMQRAGAIAFSDGDRSIQNAGLLQRSLMYVRAFDGVVINFPFDERLARNGQLNEGELSMEMGMTGINEISESVVVERDISVAEYAESKLHLYGISAQKSLEKISRARKKGSNVTASVAIQNLVFAEEYLSDYDVNYKVLPPLRTLSDQRALIRALKKGDLQCLVSHHRPIEEEGKKLEFPYAQFGSLNLETCFALANTHLTNQIEPGLLCQILCEGNRSIFGLPIPMIEKGAEANLTLFDPSASWSVKSTDIQSRSRNSSVVGMDLMGKVMGTVYKNKFHLV